MKGTYDKEVSSGEVYSFMMGLRFVNLVYVRADKDEAQGNIAWKVLRNSFNVDKPPTARGQTELGPEDFPSLGVLNGHALKLPRPKYPLSARSARASGSVNVQVTIDHTGTVVEAQALSGHRMLREVSVEAARGAKFSPTLLCDGAVKVTGTITYNFLSYR